ncbi:MAG: pyruvate kinase [Actinomycetota bacterium]|nr:pyruvate kinase [Actinomycetota bacterium]
MRRTKIVCTIGPASEGREVLKGMIEAGMNVARLNLSHGAHRGHLENITNLRALSKEMGHPIGIIMDLSGPKIRVGEVKEGVVLKEGARFTLTTEDILGDGERASISYKGFPKDVEAGSLVLINDGLIELKVEKVQGKEVVCEVIDGGELSSHKGVNLPDSSVSIDSVTEKDLADLKFGLEHSPDWVAMSFVRSPGDIKGLRALMAEMGHQVPIIAKIEKHEAARAIEAIVDEADGIMVARGDLGVEMPPEDVPLLQKGIINLAARKGKPVITATQMLNSMIDNLRPTRAEVSDVANAILDETDAVMLSGETAVGSYPVESVKMMKRIIEKTESSIDYDDKVSGKKAWAKDSSTDSISYAACGLAAGLGADAIVTPTQSGATALRISKYRPAEPIIAATPNERVLGRLAVSFGVIPLLVGLSKDTDGMISISVAEAKRSGLLKEGDVVVITAGVIVNTPGTTNLIKVHEV